MVQVTLTEGERSQIIAALEARVVKLNIRFEALKLDPISHSRDQAIDYVVDAKFWAEQAILNLKDSDTFRDHPGQQGFDLTYTST